MRSLSNIDASINEYVQAYCKKRFDVHADGMFLIEVLDYYNFTITVEEADAVYAALEDGYNNAVLYVRHWFYQGKGLEVSKEAQKIIAMEILTKYWRRQFNTHLPLDFELVTRLHSATMYHLGQVASMLVPEAAIIDAAADYIEENYI